MTYLNGLPGTKRKFVAVHVRSIDHALLKIQTRRALTTAGETGAINIWRDDSKQLRSNFCRYLQTIDEAIHADLFDLHVWLTKWWPELGR